MCLKHIAHTLASPVACISALARVASFAVELFCVFMKPPQSFALCVLELLSSTGRFKLLFKTIFIMPF